MTITVFGETVIVDQVPENVNSTSQSIVYNISQTDFERLNQLVEQLKNVSEITNQEKEFLRAIATRFDTNSIEFATALDTNARTISELHTREAELRDFYETQLANLSIKYETVSQRVQEIEKQRYQEKVKYTLYILGYSLLGVLITLFLTTFLRGRRSWFFARYIRDKIPIKF